jgi:hypothetical protein
MKGSHVYCWTTGEVVVRIAANAKVFFSPPLELSRLALGPTQTYVR